MRVLRYDRREKALHVECCGSMLQERIFHLDAPFFLYLGTFYAIPILGNYRYPSFINNVTNPP